MASNSDTIQLDLSDVDNADAHELSSRIETFYRSDSTAKNQLTWHWERNHLMLDGKQWIVFDGERDTGGLWRTIRVNKQNEYIPRPVTNYIFDVYQTLKSYLIKNKPKSTVLPNTQTYKDKNAAKIATLCIEANWERLKETENYEYAAACAITYGTIFKKDYWDNSSLQTVKVPLIEEVPTTDPATGQPTGVENRQVQDADGVPQFEEIRLGDVGTDIVEPYRLTLDPLANDLHKMRWLMEYSIQSLETIRDVFDKDLPGYTGLAGTVKEETALSNSIQRFYQLKTSSGVKSLINSGFSGSSPTSVLLRNACVLKEYYERPSVRYPKGRQICVANGVTVYAGNSPYSGPEEGDWHPYSEFRWEIFPGRFWGKSPIDDITEIQKQINSIDSVIILTRKTMAIPQKLVPLNSGIAPGSWTGTPGQQISYREGGAKPETIPPAGVDATVFQEREQRREDIKAISGAVDILKGDRPPGVTAASALNMLYEVGTGKLYPALDRWKRFIESSQKKQLKLIAKFYKEPREDYIRLLLAKNDDLSEENVNKFLGTDLYDNCNVVVEAGSNIPKLQAAKQALLLEVAQTGALNLDLPANRTEFQQQLGIVGFDNDVGPDTKRAEWENDILDNVVYSPDNQALVLDVDNHEIHMDVHSRRQKEPSFMNQPVEVQQAHMKHYFEHQQKVAQNIHDQQMQAIAATPPGTPLPPPPPSPDQQAVEPTRTHPQGKGVSQKVKNSIFGDAIKPGASGA